MFSHSIDCFSIWKIFVRQTMNCFDSLILCLFERNTNQHRLIAINYDVNFQGYLYLFKAESYANWIFCLLLEFVHGINSLCSSLLLIACKIIELCVRLTLSAMRNVFYFIFIPRIHNRFQLQHNSAIILFHQFYISF